MSTVEVNLNHSYMHLPKWRSVSPFIEEGWGGGIMTIAGHLSYSEREAEFTRLIKERAREMVHTSYFSSLTPPPFPVLSFHFKNKSDVSPF